MREPMIMEIPADSVELNEAQHNKIEEVIRIITFCNSGVFDVLSQSVKEMYLKVGGITEIMTRQTPQTAQSYLAGFLVGLEVGSILFSGQGELNNVVQMVYNRSLGVPMPRGTIPPAPTDVSRYAEMNEVMNLENCGLELNTSLSSVSEKVAHAISDDELEQPIIKGAFGLGLSVSYMADRLSLQAGDWSAALAELGEDYF